MGLKLFHLSGSLWGILKLKLCMKDYFIFERPDKIAWENSKHIFLTAIEAQESWRHRIWSVPKKIVKFHAVFLFKISRAYKTIQADEKTENERIWVGLLCFENIFGDQNQHQSFPSTQKRKFKKKKFFFFEKNNLKKFWRKNVVDVSEVYQLQKKILRVAGMFTVFLNF